MRRRTVWAVIGAFALGALMAFAVTLLRRPQTVDVTGYDAPSPADGPQAA
jgi:hypothetical protein